MKNFLMKCKSVGVPMCLLAFLLTAQPAQADQGKTSLTATINIYIGLADFNFLTSNGSSAYSYLLLRCPKPSNASLTAIDGSAKQYLDVKKTYLEKISDRGYLLKLTYPTTELNNCNGNATQGQFQLEFYSDASSLGGMVPGVYAYDPLGHVEATEYILGVKNVNGDMTLPIVSDLTSGKFPDSQVGG